MSRSSTVGFVVSVLVAGCAAAAAYLLGAGSVPQEEQILSAKAEASSASFADALPKGVAAGRERGRKVGSLATEVQALVRGGESGAREGEVAAKRQKRQNLLATQPASVTTRSEAQVGAPVDLKGSGGVLVVGDSLEVLTSPYLKQYLPSVPVTVNAEGGYNSFQIFDLFKESYDPSQSVIVFDAGTNDNPNYPEILASRLDAVSSIVGNRCMVVPTVHGFTVDGVDNRGKNRVVRAFAASHLGTQVPDWAGFVAAHPELMQSDDLHPIAEGARLRARLIAQGVGACLGRY